MKDPEEKNDYRHKQAVACHSAATSSNSPEVRRAFLELEQGWLQLMENAPEEPTGSEVKQSSRRVGKRSRFRKRV